MPDDCPFCDYSGPSRVLDSGVGWYVIKPIDPVTTGHLLFVSEAHVTDFADEPYHTGMVVAAAARWASDGRHYNLITSKGEDATQTVRHLHFHLIPRREGDGLSLPWTPSS